MGEKSNATRTKQAYKQARERCTDPENNQYHNYGGRGIKFLFSSYEEMMETTLGTPGKGLSLDRIDNEGNYEPGNTRWATKQEQGSNRRNNVRIEHKGVTRTIAEWARHYGVEYNYFHRMINRSRNPKTTFYFLDGLQ